MNKKYWLWLIIGLIFVLLIWGIWWVKYLNRAHSTFANYYAFRGCTQLLEQTPDYGICKLRSSRTIKIVNYHNKWFLDGDLPGGFFNW
jgi:hypothetical protein